jgi:hypothetical protein
MLYDLSKINYIKGQASDGTEGGVIKNYWRVFPGDFKIRRASDRPFTYKYSIEFTAVDFEDSKNMKNILAPKLGFARAALDAIKGSVAVLEKGMKYIDKANSFLEDLNSSIRDVAGILDAYANVITGYVDAAANIADTAKDIIKIPGDTSVKILNLGPEFINAGKRLLKSTKAAFDAIHSYGEHNSDGVYEFWAPQEVLDEYNMTHAEYADTWNDFKARFEDWTNFIGTTSKSSGLPEVMEDPASTEADANGDGSGGKPEKLESSAAEDQALAVLDAIISHSETPATTKEVAESIKDQWSIYSGTWVSAGPDVITRINALIDTIPLDNGSGVGGGNPGGEATPQGPLRRNVVLFYGYTTVTLNSTDTFESLAARHLGSPDRAVYIATYNGVASIDELNPGDAIKIPILTPSSRRSLNRIYARPEDRDNYGRDIYLDTEGYTAASTSGDYLLTDGVENLNQAILLRLRESVNRRIRLNAYGIRKNISDPTAGVAYIISSIDLTVSRDPRVSAVDNIKFTGAGDGLDITVDYTDINHANGSAAGRA